MYNILENDLHNLDALLSLTKDKALDYLSQLNTMPVSRNAEASATKNLVVEGIGLQETLNEFYREHYDKIVGASGPKYWGYVIGGTTPASVAGDWLTTVFDQNPQGFKVGGDISALIEAQTIGWLLELFALPNCFQGGFVSGATLSNFTCLAIGRQWAGKQNNNDIAREGIHTTIKILTATPHSSAVKSLAMLGLGSNNIITINTLPGDREAMDTDDLAQKLQENRDFPIIVISSAGTVNTGDFDHFEQIAALQHTHNFFWHIDAAFGAFAACSDQYAQLLSGWEKADSITIDCHKWLNVPYDSAIYLINEKHTQLQVQTFQNSNAPYLGDPTKDFNYLNTVPQNSRRLRALPAWFSLSAYGKKGYQWIVENNMELANTFATLLEQKTIFSLAAAVKLNIVCFTIRDEDNRDHQLAQIMDRLNERGNLFISPTKFNGMLCLRAAFVNWRTTALDIEEGINELITVSQQLDL